MPRKRPSITSDWELDFPALPLTPAGTVRWGLVFGAERPLRIEIGVGNSFFLIEVSRGAPAFSYLGFEYSRKRVLKFLKKVEGSGITNIRMLRMDATVIMDHAFEPGSVDHIYINHPDPWPKRRHARNRLVREENARRMLCLLRPGGGLSLRTDVPAYAQQMVSVLDGSDGLLNLAGRGCFAVAPLENHPTQFECRFREQGREIFYLEYEKVRGG